MNKKCDKKHIIIYTDGACSPNPGFGGWGAYLKYGKYEKKIFGSAIQTTNNRMELQAAIEALYLLKESCIVDIYTDSIYVKSGITTWIFKWKKNNWLNSDKKTVKNSDLWQNLDILSAKHELTWHWVKGHSQDPGNDIADGLACHGKDLAKASTSS